MSRNNNEGPGPYQVMLGGTDLKESYATPDAAAHAAKEASSGYSYIAAIVVDRDRKWRGKAVAGRFYWLDSNGDEIL